VTQPRGRTDEAALDVLAAGAAALARASDLDQVLRELLGAAVDATRVDRVVLFGQDPDRAALELLIAFGVPEEEVAALASAVKDPTHPIAAAAAGRARTFGRPATDPGRRGSFADLPLVVARDGIELGVGVVSFGWSGDAPPDEDTRTLVSAVADLAAVAVERARLASTAAERSEWFERLAHSDPLTGLANARTLDRILELEIARASRQGSEVSVAVFDVDDLAGTNASAGNVAGDRVLREVAAVLAESVRLVDTIARYGGDEFVLVAPGSAGMTVARRVQEGIAALPDVAGKRISVSVGLARFPSDGTDAASLIAAASAAGRGARHAGPGAIVEAATGPGS